MDDPTPSFRSVWYPRALLGALAVVFVAVVAGGAGTDAAVGRLGGDYPAFHAAGRILAEGDAGRLHDLGRQVDAQVELWDASEPTLLYFPYVPVVAAPYAALSELGYRAGYLVHTLVMVGALVGAWLVGRRLVGLALPTSTALVVALGFFPMFKAVTGQNTAVTLALFVAVWARHDRDDAVGAGVALGLLAYKPQLVVPLVVLLALDRRWRLLAWAAATVAGLTLASTIVAGVGWGRRWLAGLDAYAPFDTEANLDNFVSWLGVSQAAFGAESPLAAALGWTLAGATLALAVGVWRRTRRLDPRRWAVAACAMVLCSPHTLFYDAGLVLVPLAVLAADRPDRCRRLVGAVLVVGALHPLAPTLGVTPVALCAPALLGLLLADLAAQQSTRGAVQGVMPTLAFGSGGTLRRLRPSRRPDRRASRSSRGSMSSSKPMVDADR